MAKGKKTKVEAKVALSLCFNAPSEFFGKLISRDENGITMMVKRHRSKKWDNRFFPYTTIASIFTSGENPDEVIVRTKPIAQSYESVEGIMSISDNGFVAVTDEVGGVFEVSPELAVVSGEADAEEAPAAKPAPAKKAAKASDDSDDEDEAPKKGRKAKAAPVDDDDDEDEAPKKSRKSKASADDEDDWGDD